MIAPPPRTAERLLESLGAAPDFRDAVLGDLAEEFALRAARDGQRAARRWYYREAIRATPHLLWNWTRRLRARDVTHLAGIVLTSYVLVLMLSGVFTAIAFSVLVKPDVLSSRPPSLWNEPLLVALMMAIGGLATVMGGYIAAWLNERAPLASALALGVAWSGVSVVVTAIAGAGAASPALGSAPGWYRIVAPVVIVIGTTLGGIRRASGSAAARGGRAAHAGAG